MINCSTTCTKIAQRAFSVAGVQGEPGFRSKFAVKAQYN